MGALEIDGIMNPLEADGWMVHMNNVLEVMVVCIGRQKVSLVAYMFRGIVDTWWKSDHSSPLMVMLGGMPSRLSFREGSY